MFIFLIFFRQYPVLRFLSVIFQVSKQTLSNIIARIREFLYEKLKEKVSFGTREWRDRNSVKMVHALFTFAVDGTEQELAYPPIGDAILDTEFYSTKSGQHSINTLLFVSLPRKDKSRILGISPSFPGGTTDYNLTVRTADWWRTQISDSELGFADSGFNGLVDKGYPIITTPMQHNDLYKEMSHFRICAENRIADLKTFRALSDRFRFPTQDKVELLKVHHQYYVIGAALVNMTIK
jgi:hypothetical protein